MVCRIMAQAGAPPQDATNVELPPWVEAGLLWDYAEWCFSDAVTAVPAASTPASSGHDDDIAPDVKQNSYVIVQAN